MPNPSRLEQVLVGDDASPLRADLRELVLRAPVSLSTTQVSQLTLSIADPELRVLRGGYLAKGTRVRYRGLDLAVASRAIEDRRSGPQLVVTARSRIVRALKRRSGGKPWSNVSPDAVVKAECSAVGARCVAEAGPRRRQIVRKAATEGSPAEDDWSLFDRLAREESAIRFDVGGTVYWGRPSWLAANLPRRDLVWAPAGEPIASPALLGVPNLRDSDDDDSAEVTGSVKLVWTAVLEHAPGVALQLGGVGDLGGRFLSTGATWDALENTGTVQLASPIDPEAAKIEDPTEQKGTKR